MEKFVYDFSEGTKDMKELLGGKGANLLLQLKLAINTMTMPKQFL